MNSRSSAVQKAVIAALLLLTVGLSRSCPVGNRTGDDCGSVDRSIFVELGLEYMADIYEPVEEFNRTNNSVCDLFSEYSRLSVTLENHEGNDSLHTNLTLLVMIAKKVLVDTCTVEASSTIDCSSIASISRHCLYPSKSVTQLGTNMDVDPSTNVTQLGTNMDVDPSTNVTQLGTNMDVDPSTNVTQLGTNMDVDPSTNVTQLGTNMDVDPSTNVIQLGTNMDPSTNVTQHGTNMDPSTNVTQHGTNMDPSTNVTHFGTNLDVHPSCWLTELYQTNSLDSTNTAWETLLDNMREVEGVNCCLIQDNFVSCYFI